MIALDTNVLVRYLVDDDEEQSMRAADFIEAAIAAEERLFVSDIVVCELVWVLAGAYRIGRSGIDHTLAELVRARHLQFESTDRLTRALRSFRSGRGDLADYLVQEHAREAGCDNVVTFDRVLLKDDGFLEP
jgi:predicted nucleic-acid-binding protein